MNNENSGTHQPQEELEFLSVDSHENSGTHQPQEELEFLSVDSHEGNFMEGLELDSISSIDNSSIINDQISSLKFIDDVDSSQLFYGDVAWPPLDLPPLNDDNATSFELPE